MILHRYILRNHASPFLLSVVVVVLVFLLQFLMRFAERLIGKGLDPLVIIQLIIYNLAWMIVLVVPMSTLIASLMAFGNMSQNNEVAIMKASGMSLYKLMIAPLVGAAIVGFLLVQFNNYVYPNANHQARLLMQDISRTKPTLSLVPGVFSREIPSYSILARDIDREDNILKNLTIYDHSDPRYVNIVTAHEGKIYFSNSQDKLIMDLTDGEIHTNDVRKKNTYRKLIFNRHKIAMPADQFLLRESNPGGRRTDREMGAQQMLGIIDSLELKQDGFVENYNTTIAENLVVDSAFAANRSKGKAMFRHAFLRAENKIKLAKGRMLSSSKKIENNKNRINKFWVEVHKKYSLPFACIVFVLIGAPLGTMLRKGGVGMAAGVSLLFFMVYWAFLMGGEKLADRNLLSPFWGVWAANIVMGLLGIYFTIKSANERVTISFGFIEKILPKQFRSVKNENS